MKADHKVVMLGGMRELGGESDSEHHKLVELLKTLSFEQMVLIGEEFAFVQNDARFNWFADSTAAKNYLVSHPLADATILLKGSNSTKMWLLEEVL